MISTLADLSNSIDQIIKEMSSDELNSGLLIRSVALEHRYNPSWLELGACPSASGSSRPRIQPPRNRSDRVRGTADTLDQHFSVASSWRWPRRRLFSSS